MYEDLRKVGILSAWYLDSLKLVQICESYW